MKPIFIETIRVVNNIFFNIKYHNNRFQNTRNTIFGISDNLNLIDIIEIPNSLDCNQVYKCRVIYAERVEKIEFIPYTPKKIKTLKLIENNDIDYIYKYLDRDVFNRLKQDNDADDILIVKNGFVTDTSYSNIIFYDGNKWFTPSTYLLKGTMRTYLLETGKIFETEINKKNIKNYRFAKLINSMLGIENSEIIPIDNIS